MRWCIISMKLLINVDEETGKIVDACFKTFGCRSAIASSSVIAVSDEATVSAAASFLNNAVNPVIVGGPKLQVTNAGRAFVQLADSCGDNARRIDYDLKQAKEHHFLDKQWRVYCKEDLIEAIETTTGEKKVCLCFIEVIVHKDDTSKELLEWGSTVQGSLLLIVAPKIHRLVYEV
ncbi:pyruvate decarboxylase 1 [Striga asiatica]|uniref:Pyruvate decarboxylase 1 n=1 Tax=Striga asiatica TaxID=4170 RepID=A0A5A7RI86_STRAF|nr:pyruvate decarboxylase 1 [Striga asiatica]